MAKLGMYIQQVRGVSYKPADVRNKNDSEAVPILRANNIDDGILNFDDLVYVDRARVKQEQLLKQGDILLCASSGSKKLVGKAAQVENSISYSFGAFCKVVRTESNLQGYMGHFFQSPYYRAKISQSSEGANINNIRSNDIDSLDIDIPSQEECNARVAELDRLSYLILKRREQLQCFDDLVKSQFIEMFDAKGFPEKTLDQMSIGKGEYGAQSASIPYVNNRPRYVRITDINEDGTLNDDIVSSINEDDDISYKLEEGDFLFARMGATVGKTYAYQGGNEIFAGYLIRYKLNRRIIEPRYLFWFTKTPAYLNWVKLNQSGAAQPGINAKKYGSLRVPVPPIELQNEFARFVDQTDKSKNTYELEVAA